MFKDETTLDKIQCWIFPGAVHSLVLGSPFLKLSKTLTTFRHRIKSRLSSAFHRIRLRLMGFEQQRLWGLLNDHPILAVPDTGSDVMLVSRKYAKETGLAVDWDYAKLEVEYADGSTDWTSGVARNVQWTVGDKTILCDFHVLDSLNVDVVLSNDYLFDMDVFAEHQEHFLMMDCKEDMMRFYGIRRIHTKSDEVDDDHLEDCELILESPLSNIPGH